MFGKMFKSLSGDSQTSQDNGNNYDGNESKSGKRSRPDCALSGDSPINVQKKSKLVKEGLLMVMHNHRQDLIWMTQWRVAIF